MAKKKTKNIANKIVAWIMLLAMLGSVLTIAISALFS